ncbi:HNH endonuclease [Lyngbya sp. CCY1209]|uniref:HNH endonuclease n=1 Tax=Lyngbya sp. CCY1209 TaxID=2886103 RepID=UPI002D21515B|nr:HNH endonuclease [Lyngbya sp. CCY1209]MEB3885810.1 HNH endonuclease [Lyngbya sp. CCY1209]
MLSYRKRADLGKGLIFGREGKMSSSEARQAKNLEYYCKGLSNIKVHRNQKQGVNLNQPILLLSVIDLIAQGIIQENRIFISDELIHTFQKYWSILSETDFKGSDFALPFFHLKNGKYKFWHLQFSAEYEGGRPQTIPKLKHDVDHAYLDDELFDLVQDRQSRQELVDELIAVWFADNQKELEDLLKLNQNLQEESVLDVDETSDLKKNPKFSMRKSIIREAFFRKSVIHIYEYRCAFCQLRVNRTLNQNIVDGAHIKPFAQFYDSQIGNGISLCKNHHWALDRGWFTIDDTYKIIVAQDLQEDSPFAKPMKEFNGEKILLPTLDRYWPELESIRWHRKNIFRV